MENRTPTSHLSNAGATKCFVQASVYHIENSNSVNPDEVSYHEPKPFFNLQFMFVFTFMPLSQKG